MIHVRTDDEIENSKRRFRCGIGPELPPGDVYYFQGEHAACLADCPGCNPTGPREPLPLISGRPGHPGFEEFCRIAAAWGYP